MLTDQFCQALLLARLRLPQKHPPLEPVDFGLFGVYGQGVVVDQSFGLLRLQVWGLFGFKARGLGLC